MNSLEHDRSMLGAYALGALDPSEAQLVHDHLAGCAACRQEVAELTTLRAAMDEVPPEAFLDGPPDGGDLLLQRTIRAARAEHHRSFQPLRSGQPARRYRRTLVAAAVVLLAAVTLGGGILVGRVTAPDRSDVFAGANVQHAQATDQATGASLAVDVVPQAGWVRLQVTAKGIPQGQKCLIRVVPRSGEPILTASWQVSAAGARDGTTLQSAALVSPDDVESIEVVNTDGMRFVEVKV
ncbi:MAG TPA: zf-HC2 domain-containing protein [Actinophytocola sp.]|uniref:anti-sigma factor family protein n=1 Tax=Actinophytocola sp. TaxID=1872138 RepID=UPI002DDD5B69|nr:zf-HC2 domain-containing protein [Actinophytocola sp.]HEV2780583.1 zf-HC2 domain-containing protein [Actinophytocola sp.]